MKHNQIPDADRAKIVAILLRVISELAGGDVAEDQAVQSVMLAILELCYGSPNARNWNSALRLVTESEFVFTVRKIGEDFQFEAIFGHEMKYQ
jgi:hypothetical protein